MRHAVSLSLMLFVLWLLLSGHYEPLITGLGVASCLFVAWIAHRMDVVDHEGHPIHLTWRAAIYWPWLFWEIVKSNIAVARIILDPRLPIRPQVVRVKASQADDLGYTIYGNSITLTPGTVTIDVVDDHIEVHALADAFAEGLRSGEMDRRVTDMEGVLERQQ
ncbi:MAG: Na+/H+ antiporter subunit E [Kiloniellales bacterium]